MFEKVETITNFENFDLFKYKNQILKYEIHLTLRRLTKMTKDSKSIKIDTLVKIITIFFKKIFTYINA